MVTKVREIFQIKNCELIIINNNSRMIIIAIQSIESKALLVSRDLMAWNFKTGTFNSKLTQTIQTLN